MSPAGISSSISTLRSILGTDRAAGVEVSETVPAGKSWELRCVSVVLVQGATQTPQPLLVIDDGTNVIFESFGAAAAQGASTTQRYTWAPELPFVTAGTTPNIHSTAPMPCLPLGPGYRVRTVTLGIGANSDYGVPSLFVAEFG